MFPSLCVPAQIAGARLLSMPPAAFLIAEARQQRWMQCASVLLPARSFFPASAPGFSFTVDLRALTPKTLWRGFDDVAHAQQQGV